MRGISSSREKSILVSWVNLRHWNTDTSEVVLLIYSTELYRIRRTASTDRPVWHTLGTYRRGVLLLAYSGKRMSCRDVWYREVYFSVMCFAV